MKIFISRKAWKKITIEVWACFNLAAICNIVLIISAFYSTSLGLISCTSAPRLGPGKTDIPFYFKWQDEKLNATRRYGKEFDEKVKEVCKNKTTQFPLQVVWRYKNTPGPPYFKGIIYLDWRTATFLHPRSFLTIPSSKLVQANSNQSDFVILTSQQVKGKYVYVPLLTIPQAQLGNEPPDDIESILDSRITAKNPPPKVSPPKPAGADTEGNATVSRNDRAPAKPNANLPNLEPVDLLTVTDFKSVIRASSPPSFFKLKILGTNDFIQLVGVPKGEYQIGLAKNEVDNIIRLSQNPVYDTEEIKPEKRTKKFEVEFLIGKYEITNEQYAKFDNKKRYSKPEKNLPVTNISFQEAKEFCQWLNDAYPRFEIRLPTEAEWEYAAKHNTSRWYTWEGAFDPSRANINSKKLVEIGENANSQSWCGAIDMLGNAAEMCGIDAVSYIYQSNAALVARGGSFRSNQYDSRTTSRHLLYNANRDDIGFRILVKPRY